MKKSLMFLIALLLGSGLATAQITGGDKAPRNQTGTVTADAHADPRGGNAHKTATKTHDGGKKGHKGGKKIKITPDPSCTGPRCIAK